MRTPALALSLLALAACGSPSPSPGPDAPATDASLTDAPSADAPSADAPVDDVLTRDVAPAIAMRPYSSRAPAGAVTGPRLPLVILLHGYGASGSAQELYFQFAPQVNTRRFLYAYPDGTMDSTGRRFWNATDACCNFGGVDVDDVAYVRAIIDDMSARYPVDPQRVFLVGHSNGGFLSHRIACELSDRVAAVVTLAGVNWQDMTRCRPTRPVSVLHVHGTADATIAFNGGMLGTVPFPSAQATVSGWAMRNGCGATRASAGSDLDLDDNVAGAEAHREAHSGCMPGGAVEFWTLTGSGHIPSFNDQWAANVLDWLFAHPRT